MQEFVSTVIVYKCDVTYINGTLALRKAKSKKRKEIKWIT